MNKLFLIAAAVLAAVAAPATADADVDFGASNSSANTSSRELPPYLQCVPYARQVSGINIFGDAHTWWDQADGRYARGHKPKVGAVMAFRAHGNMRLGHVAAVSRILDSRTVLLRHANWSPIDGRRGQIENDVKAIDVSSGNDWSEVRVWYAPLQDIGTTAWPVEGFIYGNRPGVGPAERLGQPAQIAAETPRSAPAKAKPQSRDVVADIIARNS